MCTDSISVGRIIIFLDKRSLRAINLIGKVLSCRERRYRIVADLARYLLGDIDSCRRLSNLDKVMSWSKRGYNNFKGKVATGKARYLLNIVFLHLDVQIISFPFINIFFSLCY